MRKTTGTVAELGGGTAIASLGARKVSPAVEVPALPNGREKREWMICSDCRRPRALDSFAGEGGVGKGLQRAGFCTTAVDLSASRIRNYARDCPGGRAIQGDALAFIHRHGHRFAYVHASPTCTGYSRGTAALPDRLNRYERLIGVTRDLLRATGRPYTIENVEDAKAELDSPIVLCWTDFHRPGSVVDEDGTPLWMRRHRLFESNVPLMAPGGCSHPKAMQCAGAYGGARRDKVEARTIRKGGYVPSLPVMRRLLGTPWMSEKGCQLSIPPAYAEFVGEQIMEALR